MFAEIRYLPEQVTDDPSSLWPLVSGWSFNAPPRHISIRSATTTCSHDARVPRDWSGPWRVLNVSRRCPLEIGSLRRNVNSRCKQAQRWRSDRATPSVSCRPRSAPERERDARVYVVVPRSRVLRQISRALAKKLRLPSLKRLQCRFLFQCCISSSVSEWIVSVGGEGGRKKKKNLKREEIYRLSKKEKC